MSSAELSKGTAHQDPCVERSHRRHITMIALALLLLTFLSGCGRLHWNRYGSMRTWANVMLEKATTECQPKIPFQVVFKGLMRDVVAVRVVARDPELAECVDRVLTPLVANERLDAGYEVVITWKP